MHIVPCLLCVLLSTDPNPPSLAEMNSASSSTGAAPVILIQFKGPVAVTGPTSFTAPSSAYGYTGSGGYTAPTSSYSFTGRSSFSGPSGYTAPASSYEFTGQSGYTAPASSYGYTGQNSFAPPTSAYSYSGAASFTGQGGYTAPASSYGYTGKGGYTGQSGYTAPASSYGYQGQASFIGKGGYTAPGGRAAPSAATGYTGKSNFAGVSGYSGSGGHTAPGATPQVAVGQVPPPIQGRLTLTPVESANSKASATNRRPAYVSLKDMPYTGLQASDIEKPASSSASGSGLSFPQPRTSGIAHTTQQVSSRQSENKGTASASPSQLPAGVVFTRPDLSLTPQHPNNCVYFLTQDLGVNLPGGLNTYVDKQQLRNVSGSPQPGDVAIISTTGKYAEEGHLALVTNVTANSITIVEAHWKGDTVDSRISTGSSLQDAEHRLNIYGYYRP
ncbi:CHAP domain-containing protein [Bradyrhizobium guangzhouense]|uniref:CHAP domain-containing protein n=1 Tax=Bradyrhizobium guangzhouense TaxID=1325095 RepID=UPI001009B0DA|nr:CHAP domain-containing protein [Bradyrhizobium guangzhouense]